MTKSKKPSTHPKFNVMIAAAITSMKEHNGSSRQAICKYILANYKFTEPQQIPRVLNQQLRRLVEIGELKQTKGVGASGRFRLPAKKTKAPAKKTSPSKPKKTASVKKATPKKKASAKKVTPKKKTPAKKAAPKKKATPKKAKSPVKKRAPAKKASPKKSRK